MSHPLYQNHDAPQALGSESHVGLWWDKFFSHYDFNWTVSKEADSIWIQTVAGRRDSKKNKDHLARFVQRQMEMGRALGATQNVFETKWHFSTGLGLSHPVENGFAWHPSLGMPYLPGSAVKGLLRAWVEEWMFETKLEESQKQAKIRCWFGSDEKDNEKAGDLIFFDAIPVEIVETGPDIMTPHMGKWYEQGDTINGSAGDASKMPADWHSPVPVIFLVVKQGSFLFQIAPRGNTPPDEATAAMQQLQAALQWLGAGAKTAVGYGRMSEDEEKLRKLKNALPEEKIIVVPVKKIEGTETKEEVMMIETPQANEVTVETGSGEKIQCLGLPAEIEGEKPNAEQVIFIANIRREDGVIVNARWAEWID